MDHEAEIAHKHIDSEASASVSNEMRVSRREVSREERASYGKIGEDIKEPLVGAEERKLVNYMANAQSAYRASKDAAMETVSQLYMLWQATLSHAKTEGARAWLDSEVKVLNSVIDDHNKDETVLSTRLKNIADGKTMLVSTRN